MLLSGLNRTRDVLHQFLDDSACVHPEGVAIEEPGCGEFSYRDLASFSDQLYRRLYQLGVRPRDRVGIEKGCRFEASLDPDIQRNIIARWLGLEMICSRRKGRLT
jgi:hypothetical protein